MGVAAGLAALPQLSGGVPQGYLRLLVFNKDSALVSQQVQQLTQAARGSYEPLRLQVVLPQDGYVTAYVGTQSDVDVYFDDVSVEHRQGLQVQETQYDPAGLELVGLAPPSPGIRGLNNYRFNGKEFQTDLGLSWNHQDWRFLDPQIWHWPTVDPELENGQESWSPYSFGFDNAVRYADANGRAPEGSDGLLGNGGGLPNDFMARAIFSGPMALFNLVAESWAGALGTPYKYEQKYVLNGNGEAVDTQINKVPLGGVVQEAKAIAGNTLVAGLTFTPVGGQVRLLEQAAGKAGVAAYEVGTYNELKAASLPGDGIELHHAVQQQPAKSLIPHYNSGKGPAIALPKAEHRNIPTLRGTNTAGNPRSQLAKDIRDLRNNTSAPNSSLEKLIDLNKKSYPSELRKPH